jgi:2',3'-cyclic-nucleotide 2'-phosphodiesterase
VRLFFIGDIVGRSGRAIVTSRLPALRVRWKLDCVVINAENAAGGFGLTEAICDELLGAGADALTLGNHSFDQREALVFINRQPRLVRPANYNSGTPGRGAAMIETASGARVLVVNLLGRVYMGLANDPFAAAEREVGACPLGMGCDAAIIDIHAEASSEKQAMGHFLDGKVSLVVGTHTHTPTADHQIFSNGTAFMTDAGMTGDYDSIIGMEKDEPVRRFLESTPGAKMEPALGPGTLCGVAVETDDRTGLAAMIAPVRLGGRLSEARPAFWE